ncbi:MAG: hypothetical protein COU47_03310 [Candidatus Niyogibacteria bacterium CG10_big_fil_rev_8_21_14_0_10_46_36]|uniref:Uncharacterized protein n=1 Tax=Candidatus Niyogibacteria bacterium CG10_big_fil_rev_8_21_14_0_10_46_36 TaxID=1974726 RepID=A0A2H0TCU4_9BACT|nr:MAG: hypothetical protein COU47_03310 [Candidatus Niyogibacteria bacterium CG10_big_fil_rev_8_21_14_0_10_46_36]
MGLTIMLGGKCLRALAERGECEILMRRSYARIIDPGNIIAIPIVLAREQNIEHMPVLVESIQDTNKRGIVSVSLKRAEEKK